MTDRLPRLVLVVAGMLLVSGSVFGTHHTPEESDPEFAESPLEFHSHSRMFYSSGEFDLMFEYVGRFEDEPRELRYQAFTLGGYYRVLRNLKVGAFYRLQTNVRHDDDWIEVGATWLWEDGTGRSEHVAILDATPRFLLDFLPGENWVLAIKNRYEYNLTNAKQTLLVRPGLTWFWIRDREPVLNISAQYAGYFSLNFGAVPWYKHGPYVNVLYHLSPNLRLDIGVSREQIYWSESEQFLADWPTARYATNIYEPWVIDAGLIYRIR